MQVRAGSSPSARATAAGPAPHASSRDGKRARTGSRSRSHRASGGPSRRNVDLRAERFEDVGGPAFRADAAVAVLGHRQPGGSGNKGARGRDIDHARPVAAGAAAIGEQIIWPVERRCRGRQGRAAPIISSAVSPFMRRAISMPAISAGSSLPITSRSNRCSLSSRGRSSRRASGEAGWGPALDLRGRMGRRGIGGKGRMKHLEIPQMLKQKSPPVAGGQSMIGELVDQSRHRAASEPSRHQRRAMRVAAVAVRLFHESLAKRERRCRSSAGG